MWLLVEPPFACAKRCWTWVANISRRSTELHCILDYKHTIIISSIISIISITLPGSSFPVRSHILIGINGHSFNHSFIHTYLSSMRSVSYLGRSSIYTYNHARSTKLLGRSFPVSSHMSAWIWDERLFIHNFTHIHTETYTHIHIQTHKHIRTHKHIHRETHRDWYGFSFFVLL